jgi:dipeptidyl aminopeptidase/acylaminoacyl peptidase
MTADVGRIWSFELSPDGARMLVTADGSGERQPWLVPLDGSPARMVPVAGSVQRCVWHPDGSRFIAVVDPDGREDNQLALVDVVAGTAEPIAAAPGVRNELGAPYTTASLPCSPDGRWLAFATNRRDRGCFDIVVRDLVTGDERAVLTAGDGVPEDRYFPVTFSWDSGQLLAVRLHQNTEHDLYAADVLTAPVRLVTPHEGFAKYIGAAWRPEGIYLCATHQGDFTGVGLLDNENQMHWIDTPERDVDCATLSADGGTLAWGVNEDAFTGVRTCRVREGAAGPAEAVAGLPPGCYTRENSMDGRSLALSADGRTLFALDSQATLWAADLAGGTARRLTVRAQAATPPQADVVRFTSRDGTEVAGLLYRPAGPGPFPVVLHIHGGPEAQAIPESDPLIDGLLARGIAVLATNVRGSSGYGLRFQRLIYRDWGGGDVEDFRAAAEFLRVQAWADPDRLGVYGASYGGFASLSCLTRLPEYWRAGVAECAPSDLVADLRNFPATWRRRSRDWIGDLGDPDDVRRLTNASPITHAEGIRAPVLLIHGTNDTRVSIESSDVLYARLTELGKDVLYRRIDGAGHEIAEQHPGVAAMTCDWLAGNLLA